MSFRLLRSRAFWFGVPGLVFLLWGWWVSFAHHSELSAGVERRWGITVHAGEVAVYWNSQGFPDWKVLPEFESLIVWSQPQLPVEGWARWMATWRELVPGFRYVLIPYHAVILVYEAAWTGLGFWRRRKYRVLPTETGRA